MNTKSFLFVILMFSIAFIKNSESSAQNTRVHEGRFLEIVESLKNPASGSDGFTRIGAIVNDLVMKSQLRSRSYDRKIKVASDLCEMNNNKYLNQINQYEDEVADYADDKRIQESFLKNLTEIIIQVKTDIVRQENSLRDYIKEREDANNTKIEDVAFLTSIVNSINILITNTPFIADAYSVKQIINPETKEIFVTYNNSVNTLNNKKSMLLLYAKNFNESESFQRLDKWLLTIKATGEQDILDKKGPIMRELKEFSEAAENLLKLVKSQDLSDYQNVKIENQVEIINRRKEEINALEKQSTTVQDQILYLKQVYLAREELLKQLRVLNENHSVECLREIRYLFDLKRAYDLDQKYYDAILTSYKSQKEFETPEPTTESLFDIIGLKNVTAPGYQNSFRGAKPNSHENRRHKNITHNHTHENSTHHQNNTVHHNNATSYIIKTNISQGHDVKSSIQHQNLNNSNQPSNRISQPVYPSTYNQTPNQPKVAIYNTSARTPTKPSTTADQPKVAIYNTSARTPTKPSTTANQPKVATYNTSATTPTMPSTTTVHPKVATYNTSATTMSSTTADQTKVATYNTSATTPTTTSPIYPITANQPKDATYNTSTATPNTAHPIYPTTATYKH